jgi:hypothetical protein
MKTTYCLIALLMLLPTGGSAQNSRSATVRQIDSYVRSLDRFVANEKNKRIVVADTAGQSNGKPKWKRFDSEEALEKFRENSETYTIVYNWKRGGRIVASNFTLFSESGDWAQYIFHYFRSDGTTAMINSELRTFYGDYIVIHIHYFDRHGRLIRKRSKYLDLTTHKPKKPTDEMRNENSGFFRGTIYKKVTKLPFARLLGGN